MASPRPFESHSGRQLAARTKVAWSDWYRLVAAVSLAALLAYGLHHTPALNAHSLELAAIVVGIALGLSVLLAHIMRPAPPVPIVLVAASGQAVARPAERSELDLLVAIHLEALGHGFLTGLGARFMRAYEATFVDSPHAVALVATVGDTPLGALTGVLRPRAHAHWTLRRRGVRLGLLAAVGLAARPRLAAGFARTRRQRYARAWRRHRSGAAVPAPAEGGVGVLSHVAVLPGARGCGAGRALVRAFEREAGKAGVSGLTLETRSGPDGAGAFYAALGWRRSGSRTTPEGTVMEIWQRGRQ